MEIIRTLFVPGEKVLWHKVMSKDSTNERNYVVTNRRIYKKHYKIAQSDFSEYPDHVVKVLGDILIVERMGIKIIRSAHKLSLFLETDLEDQLYRFYPFEKLNKYEAEEIKTLLLDTDNLLYEEDIQSYQQSNQQSSYVQNGSLAHGYQEEKKKRKTLERKVQYLNDKINELNQNIQFQKSLVEKSTKQLEIKTQQEIGSQVNKKDLSQKAREIEDLRNKIKEVNYYANQDVEKKNKEIVALKQNIAKLIRLHSAAKPKQAALLPEDISKFQTKLDRRKQKIKEARIKLMTQRAQLIAKERERRSGKKKTDLKQKELPRPTPPPTPMTFEQKELPRPILPPTPKTFEQKELPRPIPPPTPMTLEQKELPRPIPPPIINENIYKKTNKNINSSINSSPSFSSNLRNELNELISHAKNVSSSLDVESVDLTDELHGISHQLMKEREKLIRELEDERDSIEILSQEQSIPPITIISTNPSKIEKKKDQSRLVKVGYGRRTCPVCGNQDKYPIKEVDDKENVISYSPRIYGKKFICGDCMAEWRQAPAE